MGLMRLDKYISDTGYASRKDIRNLVRGGRVTVDGAVVTQPEAKVDPDKAVITVDGAEITYAKYRYFMMDKPAGVLSATEDGKQNTVLDLLPQELRRLELFPVGRLDKDTTGLLLLTNDGEFAHRVISPKSEIQKLYLAETDGIPDEADVMAFHDGLVLRDGLQCLPAELELLGGNRCLVTVMEGKYHQVKRMLASRGKTVISLRRLRVGGLELDPDTEPGKIRELTEADLCKVFNM